MPHATAPRDVRDIPAALEVDMRAEHPVASLQRASALNNWETKLAGAERERVSRRLSIWLTLFKIYGMF